jgi:hypothetical protein
VGFLISTPTYANISIYYYAFLFFKFILRSHDNNRQHSYWGLREYIAFAKSWLASLCGPKPNASISPQVALHAHSYNDGLNVLRGDDDDDAKT